MLKTDRGYNEPSITQLAVFLQNRVGELWDVLRHLTAESVTVHALSVADSVDYAIVRLVPDRVDDAKTALREAGFAATDSTATCVELPNEKNGLLAVCQALIQAEINIHYAYPMFTRPRGNAAVVIHLDSPTTAAEVLRRHGFNLLDTEDLQSPI